MLGLRTERSKKSPLRSVIRLKGIETAPQNEGKSPLLEGKPKKIRVKVYLNPEEFASVAAAAQKAGKRPGGLQLFKQKPHGFKHELVANTKGLSKYFKSCIKFAQENEAEYARLKELEALERRKAELQKQPRP